MMTMGLRLGCLLVTLALFGVMTPTSDAQWFRSKKKKAEQEAVERVQTYQPPPVEAMEMYCEPYRKEAADLYQRAGMFRFAVQPKRSWLIRKHEKCKGRLMDQGYEYLRHVDIQKSPSLPKIENMPPSVNAPPPTSSGTEETPHVDAP